MSKCEHCPVAIGPCVGESASRAFACKMAAGGGASELRWIADESAGRPPVPSIAPAPDATTPPPRATFAELRDATKLGSLNCWFSERDAGCGCSGLQCHLLGRRINIYDCVECLRRW